MYSLESLIPGEFYGCDADLGVLWNGTFCRLAIDDHSYFESLVAVDNFLVELDCLVPT